MRLSFGVAGTVVLAGVALGCGRTPPGSFLISVGAGDSNGDNTVTTGSPSVDSDPSESGAGTTLRDGRTTGSSSTGEPSCLDTPELCTVQLSLRRAVDILFVIDNSGSMGGEQGTLARSFGAFIEVLEAQDVGANYRIGVTTTAGTGELLASSCRSRINDFIFNWQLGTIDERQRGCLDQCELETLALTQPWVERLEGGGSNLPPGIDMISALECLGPPGINGPGFEAPLESMRHALLDDSSGFVRDDAVLAIIFVTDEADCSMSPATAQWIQTPEASVFWSAPDRASSGACWLAGVDCFGGPGVYSDCIAVDNGPDGTPTPFPEQSVLFPLDRYVDLLSDISQAKQANGGQGEVVVAVLAGVPVDYPQNEVLIYQDSALPEFNTEYGIGPGCGIGTETVQDPPGIPPVRLKAFAEAFQGEEPNLFSICSDDYSVALGQIASTLGDVNERACVSGCVVDLNAGVDGLQPACTLVESFGNGAADSPVPACVIGLEQWTFPGQNIDACYRPLTDPEQLTPTPFDDMTPQCVTVGSNLEFIVERREGVPVSAGTTISVRCDLEAPVGVTCDEVEAED